MVGQQMSPRLGSDVVVRVVKERAGVLSAYSGRHVGTMMSSATRLTVSRHPPDGVTRNRCHFIRRMTLQIGSHAYGY